MRKSNGFAVSFAYKNTYIHRYVYMGVHKYIHVDTCFHVRKDRVIEMIWGMYFALGHRTLTQGGTSCATCERVSCPEPQVVSHIFVVARIQTEGAGRVPRGSTVMWYTPAPLKGLPYQIYDFGLYVRTIAAIGSLGCATGLAAQ